MKTWIIVSMLIAVSACATMEPEVDLDSMQENYEAWIEGIPAPRNDKEKIDLCRNIRLEIAKQKGISESAGDIAPNRYVATDMRLRGLRNVALLESKAAEFGCNS